ncbi:MAG: hypothetical protein ACI9O4_000519 [Chitinophagales bacterium]|jgi:hypothetical protein
MRAANKNGHGIKYEAGWDRKIFEGKLNSEGTQLILLPGYEFDEEYTGTFKDGVYQGEGTLTKCEENTSSITYLRTFKEVIRNGYGVESSPGNGR